MAAPDQIAGDTRLASGKSAARNRIAQQRYRAKQKNKFKEYEQQIEVLSKRLALLETENQSLGDRNRLLERLAQLAEQSSGDFDSDDNAPETVWERKSTAAAIANLINVSRRNRHPLVTAEEAAFFKLDALNRAKSDYVENIAVLMLRGAEPGSETLQELEEFVLQHRHALTRLVHTLNLAVVARMLAAERDRPNVFKESVATAIQMSPDQKRHLLQLRRSAADELEEIKRTRSRAAEALSMILEPTEPTFSSSPDAMLSRMHASESLRKNIVAEQQWLSRYWQKGLQILTPLQEAKALIECFPDTWLDIWLLAGYYEAEEQGTKESWLATFSKPEGVQKYLDLQARPSRSDPSSVAGHDRATGSVGAEHAQKLQDALVMADMQHQQQLPDVVPNLASAGLSMDGLEVGMAGAFFCGKVVFKIGTFVY